MTRSRPRSVSLGVLSVVVLVTCVLATTLLGAIVPAYYANVPIMQNYGSGSVFRIKSANKTDYIRVYYKPGVVKLGVYTFEIPDAMKTAATSVHAVPILARSAVVDSASYLTPKTAPTDEQFSGWPFPWLRSVWDGQGEPPVVAWGLNFSGVSIFSLVLTIANWSALYYIIIVLAKLLFNLLNQKFIKMHGSDIIDD